MTAVAVFVAVLLGLAATLVVVRMVLGPATLDRLVALDMLVAVIVCGLGAYAGITRDSSSVPVLVVVALLGFLGSVAVARFFGQVRR
jgi:multicomponent Na+:H+ antiporter subunit F